MAHLSSTSILMHVCNTSVESTDYKVFNDYYIFGHVTVYSSGKLLEQTNRPQFLNDNNVNELKRNLFYLRVLYFTLGHSCTHGTK